MKKILGYALAALALVVGGLSFAHVGSGSRLYDLKQQTSISMAQALAGLKENRIVLVGEHHSEKKHHEAQLRVIQALHESGNAVAVGLEMFRSDSQEALNQWVAGKMLEREFQKVYYDNWNFPWPTYAMIFEYARANRIPLVGLNVPRDITRQVAREGFESLDAQQKRQLSNVTCRVDREYMQYIRRAFGAHAHGDLNFIYFCEAQLVWDSVMAVHAIEFLKNHPDTVMVLLAGTGHARKPAIPNQIRSRADMPYAVILPEIPGDIEPGKIGIDQADYILLDPGS